MADATWDEARFIAVVRAKHGHVEMATLAEADRLARFLAVWDWYLDEIRKGNR